MIPYPLKDKPCQHRLEFELAPEGKGWRFYHNGHKTQFFTLSRDEASSNATQVKWEQALRDWVAYLHE